MSMEDRETITYQDLLDMSSEEFARLQEMIKDGQWKDTGFVPLDGELFRRVPANRKKVPEGMITWENIAPGRRCYFFQEAHGLRHFVWDARFIPLEVMEEVIKLEKQARDEPYIQIQVLGVR